MQSPKPTRHRAHCLIGILVMSGALRVGVLVAIPEFYGPGDPAIYYTMAKGILAGRGPEVGFIWHHLTRPAAVVHLEDYYEPVFAAVLALFLVVGGGSLLAAKCLSLAAGLATIFSVYWIGRRVLSEKAGLWAAFLIGIHPYSIYYSGLIMKEALVGLLMLWFWDVGSRWLEGEFAGVRPGLLLGLSAAIISSLQYESFPILCTSLVLAAFLYRRRFLLPVVAGIAVVAVPLLVLTWHFIGVPISAKYGFFLGYRLHAAVPGSVSRSFHVWNLLPPVLYIATTAIRYIEFPFLLFAGIQGWRERTRVRTRFFVILALAYVYFHGVPRDLWRRDWLPVLPILAVLAGGGIEFCLNTLLGVLEPVSRKSAALLLAAGIAACFQFYVGLDEIYRDHQFPNYRRAQVRRKAVSRLLRDLPRNAILLTDELPEEIYLYSGLPAVRLPVPETWNVLSELVEHYRVTHLLLAAFTADFDWRPVTRDLHVQSVRTLGQQAGQQYFLVTLVPPTARNLQENSQR